MNNNNQIRQNLLQIKHSIRDKLSKSSYKQNVDLIAVSKTFDTTRIIELYNYGQRAFGESYAQEFINKARQLGDLNIEWHFIGNLQSNKIKRIAPYVSWVHSVEKLSQAQLLSKYRASELSKINILIQINFSNSDNRHGIPIQQVSRINSLAQNVNSMPNLRFRGFMAIASNISDAIVINDEFRKMNILFTKLKGTCFPEIDSLSMGMSNDYELAILNGATIVRIGSKIFGTRNYNT